MSDPDVRIVIEGVERHEEAIARLLRERAKAERADKDAQRALARIDAELQRLEKAVRRGP